MNNRNWFVRLAMLALLALPGAVLAQTALNPLPIEKLFDHPRYGGAQLSPNTKLMATTAKVGERMRLVVIDLETQKAKPVIGFPDVDVNWFRWINDRRLVFTVGDQSKAIGDQPGGGLFAVDADGGDYKELMPTVQKQVKTVAYLRVLQFARFLAPCKDSDDILITKSESGKKGVYIMRQNTRTGRDRSLVMGIEGTITNGWADKNGELRGVQSIDSEGRVLLWHRANADAAWQEVARFSGMFAPDLLNPVGFSPDGKSMWVSGQIGRDTAAIYAFDLEKKKLGEMLLSHPSADIDGGLRIDRETGELLGVVVDADKRQPNWFNAEWGKVQATVDAALTGTVNMISGDPKSRILVHSYSDRDPGRYHLYDVKKKMLVEQLASKPEIQPAQGAETKMIRYEARDKLSIPAYLTLPPAGPKAGLPLIVLVHGGPYVRDGWGFDPEVQFLASRGYVVLQPQYRGSTGFGARLFRGGWKTWGLAMQDDVTDGVQHLVKNGTVDPKRVCIMGASYGGYATMMGLAKDPELYRCGVSFVGVSDIGLMFTVGWSDFANSLWSDFGMKELIGDPDKMKEQFDATSAVKQAGRIKAPLFLAHSSEDYRVPIIHAEKMRDALKAAGKEFEWHNYAGEGHGLMKVENRVKHYRAIEAFLAKYIGGAVEGSSKAAN